MPRVAKEPQNPGGGKEARVGVAARDPREALFSEVGRHMGKAGAW